MCVEKYTKVQSYPDPDTTVDRSTLVGIYYAQTEGLGAFFGKLQNFLSEDEVSRASKFQYKEDRKTYITCHAVLRIILSKWLDTEPAGLTILAEKGNRPALPGNPLFFNLAHTRTTFAIAVSRHFHLGVDLEDLHRKFDFMPILKSFFSPGEQAFILESGAASLESLLMLWTRKEAYLKAKGTGLSAELSRLDVLGKNTLPGDEVSHSICNDHFIYSVKVLNHYLSIAIPHHKSCIILNQITGEGLFHPLSRKCNTEQQLPIFSKDTSVL